jgi:hypothetical protein
LVAGVAWRGVGRGGCREMGEKSEGPHCPAVTSHNRPPTMDDVNDDNDFRWFKARIINYRQKKTTLNYITIRKSDAE